MSLGPIQYNRVLKKNIKRKSSKVRFRKKIENNKIPRIVDFERKIFGIDIKKKKMKNRGIRNECIEGVAIKKIIELLI